jgi:glycosyltransferase involved in cell wall biosynthesis
LNPQLHTLWTPFPEIFKSNDRQEKMKKVSLILTTYNSEKTLQRILDSIFAQEGLNTLFEIELIVVDDCSTDKTRAILEQNKIEYFSTSVNSGGPNKGRNIGLSKVTGDFFCILDHDDEWLPNKIKEQLAVSEIAPVITSGFIGVDLTAGKKFLHSNQEGEAYKFFDTNVTFRALLARAKKAQGSYLGSAMFRGDMKSILFEEHFGMIDFDYGLRVFKDRKSVEVCKPLYKRYVSGLSNLSLNEAYRRMDFYYSLMTIEEYEASYPKEAIQGYKKVHGVRARYYYFIGNMPKARFYFLRSEWSLKMFLYYLTTFVGSDYVKRKFNVFG